MNRFANKAVKASAQFWRARGVLLFAGDLQARYAVWKYCVKLQHARAMEAEPPPQGRGHLMATLHPDDMAAAEVFAKKQEIAQLKRERAARLVDRLVK